MSWTRNMLAALLAATVALAPGVLGACYTVFGPLLLNPDGTSDDAPMRGAGLFLFASPLLFGMLLLFYAVSIQALHRVARLSLPSLCSVSVAVPLAVWLWLIGRGRNDLAGGTVPITVMCALIGAFLLAGAVASWIVVRRAPNKPLQPTRACGPRG